MEALRRCLTQSYNSGFERVRINAYYVAYDFLTDRLRQAGYSYLSDNGRPVTAIRSSIARQASTKELSNYATGPPQMTIGDARDTFRSMAGELFADHDCKLSREKIISLFALAGRFVVQYAAITTPDEARNMTAVWFELFLLCHPKRILEFVALNGGWSFLYCTQD